MLGLTTPTGAEARAVIEWIAAQGARAIQLNAAAVGLRARELDRSARRDIAAMLRRLGMSCSGLDLFIPPEHFVSTGTADRATESVLSTIELAAELSSLAGSAGDGARAVVCVLIPRETSSEVVRAINQRAELHGVHVANHAYPIAEHVAEHAGIRVGLDCAVVLTSGDDPVRFAASLGPSLAALRVTDATSLGTRVVPGRGRLDLNMLGATLAVANRGAISILDVRGLNSAQTAVRETLSAWPA